MFLRLSHHSKVFCGRPILRRGAYLFVIAFVTLNSLTASICPGPGIARAESVPPLNVLYPILVSLLSYCHAKRFLKAQIYILIGISCYDFPPNFGFQYS